MADHELVNRLKKNDYRKSDCSLDVYSDNQSVIKRGFDYSCFTNYKEASQAILKYLYKEFDFDLWMITKVKGQEWIILEASDNNYDVKSGNIYQWQDSFCSRMVKGKGPNIALDVESVPEYLDAEIRNQFAIGSYIGLPMYTEQGVLLGTLCAIDPSSQQFDINKEFPQLQMFSRILASLLNSELKTIEHEREIGGIRNIAHYDELTGLLNRGGWNAAVQREQERLEERAYSASVFTFDLDGLKVINDSLGHYRGDELLKDTAECLLSSVRQSDVVARLGGDEFAILAVECGPNQIDRIFQSIRQAFFDKKISVSIGQAVRRSNESLRDAIHRADMDMCLLKQWKSSK